MTDTAKRILNRMTAKPSLFRDMNGSLDPPRNDIHASTENDAHASAESPTRCYVIVTTCSRRNIPNAIRRRRRHTKRLGAC
jgi:hypothetical protein